MSSSEGHEVTLQVWAERRPSGYWAIYSCRDGWFHTYQGLTLTRWGAKRKAKQIKRNLINGTDRFHV